MVVDLGDLVDDRLVFTVRQNGTKYDLLVNGQWAGPVVGPATGAIIAEWLTTNADDLISALGTARKIQRQNAAIAGVIQGQRNRDAGH